MKKIILITLLCGVIFVGAIGCKKEKEKTINDLKVLQDKITDIVSSKQSKDYQNFAACYVDEEKNMVIVELVDNSKEKQDWFKKNVIDSRYIRFEKGGPYYTSGIDFYLTKPATHNDIKFNDYYKSSDRTIYLAGNVDEFYIVNENRKETLKHYIAHTSRTLDESIKSITNKLDKKAILKDGGTTIYKSKEKDITIIVCNTLDKNRDVFIGDYKVEYEQYMCNN